MSRFTATCESTAATGGDVIFANLVAGASANFKLRRIVLGCRAGAVVPTSQQLQVEMFRATARGFASATEVGERLDPGSHASQISGLDRTWTVVPTLGSVPLARFPFNSQSGMDVPAELLEEYICNQGTANGFAFRNADNVLPANHQLVLTVEWEE